MRGGGDLFDLRKRAGHETPMRSRLREARFILAID